MLTLRRILARLRPVPVTPDEARAMEFAAAHDLDGMPSNWPAFTVDMFEQADAAAEVARAEDRAAYADPLVAFLSRRLWAHDEAVAYSRGQDIAEEWDLPAYSAVAAARPYLDDREHGAHLAALVLAGYCGIPAEDVR